MEKTVIIEGMTCGHCAGRVKKEIEAIAGVESADVSADEGKAVVEMTNEVDDEKLAAAVEEAGYEFIKVS